LTANDQELKTYIETRKKDFHDDCIKFGEMLLKQVETYKKSIIASLETYKLDKQKQFDELYNLNELENLSMNSEERLTNIQLIKAKIIELRDKIALTNSKVFIKNILWITILLVVSLYDFIFLNKIFVDIFDVQG
jgi:hypothetical protein